MHAAVFQGYAGLQLKDGVTVQRLDVSAARRGHARLEHLDDDGQLVVDRSRVGHLADDPFLEEGAGELGVAPVVEGLPAAFHPVFLDQVAAGVADQFAVALGEARQEVAHHQGVGPERQGDEHVRRSLYAAVAHERKVVARGPRPLVPGPGDFLDGGSLPAAGGLHHLRRAAGCDAHADLDGVRAAAGQVVESLPRHHVAGDHRDVVVGLDPFQRFTLVFRVAVGGVDDDHVGLVLDQCFHALAVLGVRRYGGADHQALLRVLRGMGMADVLVEIPLEYHRHQRSLGRNHGQEPAAVFDHPRVGRLQVVLLGAGLHVRLHAVGDPLRMVVPLVEVLVRDHAHQLAVEDAGIRHGEGVVAGIVHDADHLADGLFRRQGDDIRLEPGLEPLHRIDPGALLLDGLAHGEHAHAPQLGHGDGQFHARDRLHGRAEKGRAQRQVAVALPAETRLQRHELGVCVGLRKPGQEAVFLETVRYGRGYVRHVCPPWVTG